MGKLAIITLSLAGIVFLYIVYYIIKGIRDKNHPTPDDLLHDLSFKIEYSVLDLHSELYLIDQIKMLRLRSDIDKERLNVLDQKFRERFKVLHSISTYENE